jgi:hypothetical protein
VEGVLGSRALIELDDGGQASVAEELTLPGVPLQSIFRRGMKVRGRYDAGRGTLDARGMLPDDATQRRMVKNAYHVGKVVVGRVESVTESAVTIAVAPAVHVRVPRERVTGNALDALDDLFTPGEVALARRGGSSACGWRFISRKPILFPGTVANLGDGGRKVMFQAPGGERCFVSSPFFHSSFSFSPAVSSRTPR